MTEFKTLIDGRVHVHALQHTRFRTKDFTIRLHMPMTREQVTQTALLPHMWMNGTKRLPTTRDLTIAADNLYGTVLRTSLGKRGPLHVLEVSVSIPDVQDIATEHIVDEAIQLACDVLLDHARNQSAFTADAVRQEIDLHRRRIEAARDDKMSFALQRCVAEVCAGTPAALPRLGFLDDLKDISNDMLYDAYEFLLKEAEVHAYLVGPYEDPDVFAQQILTRLAPLFPGAGARSKSAVDALPLLRKKDFQNVHEHQDMAQGQLDVGYRTGIDFADGLYPALLMMNGIFGGFAHSKLFANVREKHSLAYTVWSHLDPMTGVLAVMTGINPENYAKALDIVQAQLEAIRAGEITDDEMTFTLRGLENQYTVLLDQPSALASWHYNGVVSGKHRDISTLLAQLKSISKEDVAKVAGVIEPNTVYFLSKEGDAS